MYKGYVNHLVVAWSLVMPHVKHIYVILHLVKPYVTYVYVLLTLVMPHIRHVHLSLYIGVRLESRITRIWSFDCSFACTTMG